MKDVTLRHDFTLKMLAALVLQLYTPEVDMQATAVLGRIRPVSSGTVSDRSLVSLSHCFLSHTHRVGSLWRGTRETPKPLDVLSQERCLFSIWLVCSSAQGPVRVQLDGRAILLYTARSQCCRLAAISGS